MGSSLRWVKLAFSVLVLLGWDKETTETSLVNFAVRYLLCGSRALVVVAMYMYPNVDDDLDIQ